MPKHKGATLLRIFRPTDRDIEFLKAKFSIHPVILHELKTSTARARVEQYNGYLFFVYYFPLYDPKHTTTLRAEIDFIITRNTVIAVHNEKIEVLDALPEVNAEGSLKLLYDVLQALIEFQERQLRHVREKVEGVGKELFKDKEKEVLEKISYLKRDISEYRIIVRLEQTALQSLLHCGRKFWSKGAEIYLNDLIGDHLRIVNQVENYREATNDFEDTNTQLMSLKINIVMKTFTILSFLTFPFVLAAAILGIPARDIPIIDLPGSFWIIIAIMAICMSSLVLFFKRKGWF
jgi:magnesium transporter